MFPKPQKRYRASVHEWTNLRFQKVDGCRNCGSWLTIDLHHLVPRSLGGPDVAENLIPLCHPCHMVYEDRATGWLHVAHRIRESLTQPELAFALTTKGRDWFDRYYPALEEAA